MTHDARRSIDFGPVLAHYSVMPTALAPANNTLNIRGSAVIYRLFDVGYAIDLNRVQLLLAPATLERARPERVEAQALQIPNATVFHAAIDGVLRGKSDGRQSQNRGGDPLAPVSGPASPMCPSTAAR